MTTNLLTPNQATGSDALQNATGFACGDAVYGDTTNGGTVTSSTNFAWQGSRSIKWQGNGNTAFIFGVAIYGPTVAKSTTYTLSAYLHEDPVFGSSSVFMLVIDQTLQILGLGSGVISLTNSWVRSDIQFTTTNNTNAIECLFLDQNPANNSSWYIDGLQVELGSVATPWVSPIIPLSTIPVGIYINDPLITSKVNV